jgi:hypothetical protein
VNEAVFSVPPEGGMTYANWRFGHKRLDEVASSFHLDNDPGPASHLYLQLYDAPIDGAAMYHGVQTTNLAIFSRFGTVDLDDVRVGRGAYKVAGTDEGPYVSLRMPFMLGVGAFRATVRRTEGDHAGDWFEYRIARQHDPAPGTLVGAIRFPRRRRHTPAAMADGGGTWTECWDNNGAVLHPVPLWALRLDPPMANGSWRAQGVTLRYSRMPNAASHWDARRSQLVTTIGGQTRRTEDAASTIRLDSDGSR